MSLGTYLKVASQGSTRENAKESGVWMFRSNQFQLNHQRWLLTWSREQAKQTLTGYYCRVCLLLLLEDEDEVEIESLYNRLAKTFIGF